MKTLYAMAASPYGRLFNAQAHTDQSARANLRTHEETLLASVVQRKHATSTRNHIDYQISMLPGRRLRGRDVKRHPPDFAQTDIALAQTKLTLRKTHRARSIAATARLMKYHRTMIGHDLFNQLQ